jgi:hypothetical protein
MSHVQPIGGHIIIVEVVFAAELEHRGQQIKVAGPPACRTGDMVRAVVTTGKRSGTYVGRVAVRATGSFNIRTPQGTVQGIGYRCSTLLQYSDGYSYGHERGKASPPAS